MNRVAHLERELASELSGDQGGEIQWRASLTVQVARDQVTIKKLRAELKLIAECRVAEHCRRIARRAPFSETILAELREDVIAMATAAGWVEEFIELSPEWLHVTFMRDGHR